MPKYERGRAGGGGTQDQLLGRGGGALAPGKQTLVGQLPGGGAIQRKPGPAAGDAPAAAGGSGGGGRPLPPEVRAKMEAAMNADFSAVRIHEGAQASAMGALAYTQGTDIYFAPGQYDPYSSRGQELLGHELAHVIQQAQGRVSATAQAKGVDLNDDPSLEREADELGTRASRGEHAGGASRASVAAATGPVQRKKATDTAKERSIQLDEVQAVSKSGVGKATVMDPDKNPGKSLAADPLREAQNEEFERRLGIAAFNDPRANDAAAKLAVKVEKYLDVKSRSVGSWQELEAFVRDVTQRLAGEKNFAGTVTQPIKSGDQQALEQHATSMLEVIHGVIREGNLRERMNLIDQFMKLLGRDFAEALKGHDKLQELLRQVESAGMDPEAFQQAADSSEKRLTDEDVESSITGERRDQVRVAANKPTGAKTNMTPQDLRHTPLSSRERQYQGELEKESGKRKDSLLQQGFNRPLHFTEGARYFLVNEQSKWAETLHALNLPLKAGPSGHTDLFFRANQLLGANIEPDIIRLLAIGHLLPIRAHSLIEILDISAKWGCKLSLDGNLYKNLAPYSEAELRTIAGGALPGEQAQLPAFKPWDMTDVVESHREEQGFEPDPKQLAFDKARKDEQGRELAKLKQDAPVTALLGDKARREPLEEHVYEPKLTGNIRDALELAREVASKEEPKARAEVEKRLTKLGFDLEKQPDLYDRIVERVRQSPVSINVRTNIIETLLQGGEYLNQWERSVHPAQGGKAFYGGGKYAVDRNETEKVLHGLPEMEEIGEAASDISVGWDEHNKASVSAAQKKIDELPALKEKHQTLTGEIASLEEVVGHLVDKFAQVGTTKPEAAKAVQEQYAARYKELEAKKKQAAQLAADIKKLEAELPSLKLALKQAELEAQVGKGTIHDMHHDEQGFREKRSLPVDRPHSAAVHASYRAGAAAKTTYGTSHLVLRDDVKDRSTIVGGDSLEQIYKPNKKNPEQALAEVGTFEHLGVALLYCQEPTLRLLAEEASNPTAPRAHKKGNSDTGLYLEVQVFGAVKMSRDVSKIVIDEDDLDAWEKGLLVDYHNQKLPVRTRKEIKDRIEGYAKAYGIDVQYIRTGAYEKPGGFGALRGPGEHLAARRQGWEETSETILKAFRAGNWATGLALSEGARDMGKGSMFGPSYATTGIAALAKSMEQLQALAAQKGAKQSEEQLMKLAADTLTSFYASPFSPDHLDEVQRVLTNSIVSLRTCIQRSLSEEDLKQDRNQEKRPGVDTELLKRLNQERARKKEQDGSSVSPETSVDKPTSQPQESEQEPQSGINHDYQYEDMDMYRILTLMVEQAGLENVHVVPPCDNIVGQQLRARLQEEAQQHLNQARSILVPYNLGNYHWVGIFIQVGEDEGNVRVWYMDPLQGLRPAPRSVEQEIKQVYAEAAFPVAARMMQSDGTSCGPVTIRNLMLRAQGQAPVASQVMDHGATEELRQEHVALVNEHVEGSDFEVRQQENRSSIRSVFNVHQYLATSGTSSFSPKEYQRILQIIDDISKLGEEARLAIWAAFSSIRSNPNMDNAFYYQTLRKALHTSFTIVQQGHQLPDQQLMDRILQNLWGITFAQAGQVVSFDDVDRFKFRDFEQIKAIGMQLGQDKNRDKVLEALNKTIEEQEAAMKKLAEQQGKPKDSH